MKKFLLFLLAVVAVTGIGLGAKYYVDQQNAAVPINTRDDNFVSTGPLTKVGQFSVDSTGSKTELIKIVKPNETFANARYAYTITEIQFRQNSASKNGLKAAKHIFHDTKLSAKYQTIIIKYQINSSSSANTITDGIDQLLINGTKISAANGLDNDPKLNSTGVLTGQTTSTFANAILPTGNAETISKIGIVFAPQYADGVPLADQSEQFNLQIQK
jgi:hypothetical protein